MTDELEGFGVAPERLLVGFAVVQVFDDSGIVDGELLDRVRAIPPEKPETLVRGNLRNLFEKPGAHEGGMPAPSGASS